MKRFNKKALTIVFALVLAVSFATVAFSSPQYFWLSFQSDNTNNGTIDNGMPHMTANPVVTPLSLPGVNPASNIFAGVDAATVIYKDVAYTLYNGGDYNGTVGGARIAATALNSSPSIIGDYLLDASANNVQQLSTPTLAYTPTSGDVPAYLYAATTSYMNALPGSTTSGWVDSSGSPLASFTFPVGTTTISYAGLYVPSAYWQPQMTLTFNPSLPQFAALSGTVALSNAGTTINFGTSSYWENDFTLYNNNGSIVPNGTYTLTLTITNGTGAPVTAAGALFNVSQWKLFQMPGSPPNPANPTMVASGYGQANTPIQSDSQGNVYFGIYEGDRAYYQYMVGGTLLSYRPIGGGDDFYWAGSVNVTVGGTEYMVFGGDKGYVYVRPAGVNFVNYNQGNIIDVGSLTGTTDVGEIRSTLVAPASGNPGAGNLYITSKGAPGANGYLWSIVASTITSATPTVTPPAIVPNSNSSTSTPVISANGNLYIGTNDYDQGTFTSSGTVQAFDPTNLSVLPVQVYPGTNDPLVGDPVQSSPIVYTDTESTFADYVYFTTNLYPQGSGYCYSFDGVNAPLTYEWTYLGNNTALQGFSTDIGYLIYGDDSNTVYVVQP